MMGRSKEGGDRLLSVILRNTQEAVGRAQNTKHIIFHLNVRMYSFSHGGGCWTLKCVAQRSCLHSCRFLKPSRAYTSAAFSSWPCWVEPLSIQVSVGPERVLQRMPPYLAYSDVKLLSKLRICSLSNLPSFHFQLGEVPEAWKEVNTALTLKKDKVKSVSRDWSAAACFPEISQSKSIWNLFPATWGTGK